jgi:5-enolpyruvylshikimate-3-phosphate synthase
LIDINLALQGDDAKSVIRFLEQLGYEIHHADTKEIIGSNDENNNYSCDIICKKRSL